MFYQSPEQYQLLQQIAEEQKEASKNKKRMRAERNRRYIERKKKRNQQGASEPFVTWIVSNPTPSPSLSSMYMYYMLQQMHSAKGDLGKIQHALYSCEEKILRQEAEIAMQAHNNLKSLQMMSKQVLFPYSFTLNQFNTKSLYTT